MQYCRSSFATFAHGLDCTVESCHGSLVEVLRVRVTRDNKVGGGLRGAELHVEVDTRLGLVLLDVEGASNMTLDLVEVEVAAGSDANVLNVAALKAVVGQGHGDVVTKHQLRGSVCCTQGQGMLHGVLDFRAFEIEILIVQASAMGNDARGGDHGDGVDVVLALLEVAHGALQSELSLEQMHL